MSYNSSEQNETDIIVTSLRTTEELEYLQNFVDDLNGSNGTNDKLVKFELYKDSKFIRQILYYVYTPYKQYGVTSDNIKKFKAHLEPSFQYYGIFELLDDLATRKITGHDAIKAILGFIQTYPKHSDLILNIIDRDLKTRFTATLINKVVPDLIPSFDVALANKYDEKQASKIDFKKDRWFGSHKIDSLRLATIVNEAGDIRTYSREGHEFFTLQVLIDEIKKFNLKSVVFDGEVAIVDENGVENFQQAMKEIKKKDHTIERPKYFLFDLIPLDIFFKKSGGETLSKRFDNLQELLKDYSGTTLTILKQTLITSHEHLAEMNAEASKNDWEGIMVRKDIPYEGKRSNNLLKCKKFFDAEYLVEEVVFDDFRSIVDKLEVTENVLSSVVINHKGFKVNVGSGFSLEQRRKYKKNPELIIGNQITVAYFEETSNEKGGISLRFPTVKHIYENGKRDV